MRCIERPGTSKPYKVFDCKQKIKKRMKSYPGFFPRKDGEKIGWFTNYKIKIAVRGPEVDLAPPQINRNQVAAQKIIDVINFVTSKKAEYDAAMNLRDEIFATEGKVISNTATIIKNHYNFTDALGAEVGIMGGSKLHHEDQISPKLKVVVFPTSVEINFLKRYTHGISLYRRIVGPNGEETDWEHIGYCHKSPFVDKDPVTENGIAELREYTARCVKNMEEIGQHSGIVSALFGGRKMNGS
jgi:hypothetical protein